jgi:prepilin-type N-terminal cleavage/methylation domain-containing protein
MKNYVAFKACPRNISYSPAFTIVELLVVIVVIGILAAISTISYNGITSKAVVASLQSDLSNASKQLEMYKIENGAYPTANKCPTTSPTEICLKASNDNTFTYKANTNPPSFTLTESNANGIEKYITDKNAIPTSEVNQTFNATSTGSTGTIQTWTVPITGSYVIDAYGAQGGYSYLLSTNTINPGGKGAWIKGTFNLTAGQVISILVGQPGYDYANNFRAGGGGGGTFITNKEDGTLLIAAGGGGGAGQYVTTPAANGQSGTDGGSGTKGPGPSFVAGGISGAGGGTSTYSGGGGGWLTNGIDSTNYGKGGKSFSNNGEGGVGYRSDRLTPTIDGGFGGGGGAYAGGGGGGGYSGGGAGGWLSSSSGNGGGGGSFNGGDNQSNTAGDRIGSGLVIIKSQ